MDEINDTIKDFKNSNSIVKYLLVTQWMTYLGFTLPSATIICVFGTMLIRDKIPQHILFVTKDKQKIKISQEEVQNEEPPILSWKDVLYDYWYNQKTKHD